MSSSAEFVSLSFHEYWEISRKGKFLWLWQIAMDVSSSDCLLNSVWPKSGDNLIKLLGAYLGA